MYYDSRIVLWVIPTQHVRTYAQSTGKHCSATGVSSKPPSHHKLKSHINLGEYPLPSLLRSPYPFFIVFELSI